MSGADAADSGQVPVCVVKVVAVVNHINILVLVVIVGVSFKQLVSAAQVRATQFLLFTTASTTQAQSGMCTSQLFK